MQLRIDIYMQKDLKLVLLFGQIIDADQILVCFVETMLLPIPV